MRIQVLVQVFHRVQVALHHCPHYREQIGDLLFIRLVSIINLDFCCKIYTSLGSFPSNLNMEAALMYSSDNAQKGLVDAALRMACIAEYREGNNTSHIERMRGYAQVLARGLGLNNREAQIVSAACQLHDIGKVGIPEALLLKIGDFTANEWEVIKRHTVVGGDLLKGSVSPFLHAGESVALTHHERWDGSGYPTGLKGEDFPLGGRICAVADVFDALTTPRLYKKEISVDDARRLIVDAGGSLFDPKVVEIFDEEFDEILKIRKSHS